MANLSVTSAPFSKMVLTGSNPAVETNRLRIRNYQTHSTISQRLARPGNGLMAQLSELAPYWAEMDDVTPDGWTYVGDPYFMTSDGWRYWARGELTHPGLLIGTRHFVCEGIIRIDSPLLTAEIIGDDSLSNNRGGLSLSQVRQSFVWSNGTSDIILNDPSVIPPVDFPSAAVPPAYTYFHFSRHWNAANTEYDISFHVNGNTYNTTAPGPINGAASTGQKIDEANASIASLNPWTYALWMRTAGSDSELAGTVGNLPWGTPVLYEEQTFEAHGDLPDGAFDCGQPDQYWHTLTFDKVLNQYGSALQLKATALNNVPSGSLTSLWSSLDWKDIPDNKIVNLFQGGVGYPVGRYLFLQLRFTPSSTAPMAGGTSRIFPSSTGAAAILHYQDTAPAAPGDINPFPGNLENSEGLAVHTIPVQPQYAFLGESALAVSQELMGKGYTSTFPLGTEGREAYSIEWPAITDAEKVQLENFFEERRGGHEPFFITPADSDTPIAVKVNVDEIEYAFLPPSSWSIAPVRALEAAQ